MSTLKEVLRKKIDEHRPRTTRLVKECGDVKLGDVTIAQAIGLSLIHISEPTRLGMLSRMPSSA